MFNFKKSLMLLCFVLSIFFITTSKVSAAPSTLRLAGNDRYKTSVKIAELFGSNNGVFITSGENFPDALSASSIAAYAYDWPSNGREATAYSINQAHNIASKYGATIKFDDNSKNPYFNYTDSSGIYHSV